MLRKTAFLLGLVVLNVLPAEAQLRPTESVTVTGIKPSEQAIDDFLFSHTAPSRTLGKIARWKTPVCPLTVGLGTKYAAFVSQRIRQVAAQTGAPVDTDKDCKPNIRLVFTTKPQELLDNVRRDHSIYLGFFQNRLQSAQLAAIKHPIQSWYTTATADLRGSAQIDSGKGGGVDFSIYDPGNDGAPTVLNMSLPNASARNVTGNRLNDGLSSEFYNALIVAEPAKLMEHEIGTLADYIAMLALADPGSLETCAEFPTILNLLVPGCVRIATHLTEGDLAYLKALYKMTPANTLLAQRGQMRYQMQQALK